MNVECNIHGKITPEKDRNTIDLVTESVFVMFFYDKNCSLKSSNSHFLIGPGVISILLYFRPRVISKTEKIERKLSIFKSWHCMLESLIMTIISNIDPNTEIYG